MSPCAMDPCLFFRRNDDDEFDGAQAVLVDGTIGTGTEGFAEDEKLTEKHFQTKACTEKFPMKFNGVDIKSISIDDKHCPCMTQFTYSKAIQALANPFSSDEFATIREKVAYVAVSTRPDMSFLSAKLAQTKPQNATLEDRMLLNHAIKRLHEDKCLVYRNLYLKSLKIVGYSDASFARNHDLSSQLGMFILLTDQEGRACIVHYASWKCRRVTRSILAAEIYAFASCLDDCLALRYDLKSILNHRLKVELFTDSKSLFDTITKLTSLSEKRLLIDVSAIRETYQAGDLDNVAHVSTDNNIADCLTKEKKSPLLDKLMCEGLLSHAVNQWIIWR